MKNPSGEENTHQEAAHLTEADREPSSTSKSFRPDYLDELALNVARVSRIRFSSDCLAIAVSHHLLGLAISSLVDVGVVDEETCQAVIVSRRLQQSTSSAMAVTDLGNSLVVDRMGNHAIRQVERALDASGFTEAMRRVDSIASSQMDPDVLRRKAVQITQAMINDLDSLANFAAHLAYLIQIRDHLSRLITEVQSRLNACRNQAATLDRQLRQQTQPTHVHPTQVEGAKGTFRRWAEMISRWRGKVVQAPSGPPATTIGPSILQRDRLRIALRVAVLGAEEALLMAMINLIGGEIERDEEAIVSLATHRYVATQAARRAEWTREYGIAAGELLLGGHDLTEATVGFLLGTHDSDRIVATINGLYAEAHGGQTLLSASGGVITDEMITGMSLIIDKWIKERMKDFTIVDALVALHQCGGGISNKILEVLKHSASLEMLAPNYGNYLKLQTFASISYAPSISPGVNDLFDNVFSLVRKSLPLEVSICHDYMDPECLLFYCEYFCVPLPAFAFADESYSEFESVKDDLRYVPHPDLHK